MLFLPWCRPIIIIIIIIVVCLLFVYYLVSTVWNAKIGNDNVGLWEKVIGRSG